MNRIINSEVGKRLKALRQSQSFTQREFANRLNVTTSNIGHLETGKSLPSVQILFRIKNLIHNTNLNWLITGEGEMFTAGNVKGGKPVYKTAEQHPNPFDGVLCDPAASYASNATTKRLESEIDTLKAALKDKEKIIKMLEASAAAGQASPEEDQKIKL